MTNDRKSRLRWLTLGEAIAIAALILSGLGLWHEWTKRDDGPKVVVEKPAAIPLALRGQVEDNGKALRLLPVEDAHVLDSLTVTALAPAKGSAPFGSEPLLSAAGIEDWLPDGTSRDRPGSLAVTIRARYVEHGATRTATARYRIDYRWKDGGLFAGKQLRLTGFGRA